MDRPMAHSRRRLALALITTLLAPAAGALAAPAPQPVTISGDPVAPPLAIPGTGLCVASAISVNPTIDFPQSTTIYNQQVNVFLEAHSGDRITSVMRSVFDLSNNDVTGPMLLSYGDFTNSMPGACRMGGCDFVVNNTTTSFASRFRGFFNVTSDLAGHPLHIGFYLDDAVSLTFYDKSQNAYPVMTRPPVLGAATWRSTNTVTFSKAGLYPLEIVYVQIVEHAALEMSVLDGAFTDFELPVSQVGSINLDTAGFKLLGQSNFFETDDGAPPFSDPSRCAQCDRQFANLPGNGGCGPGLYCNEAALCAPCNSSLFCGPSCSPCGGNTPFCVNLNGQSTCVQCLSDSDCMGGHKCDQASLNCVHCDTRESCAGASCNCCSGPASLKCEPLTMGGTPLCVECASDGECGKGLVCDTVNGRCVQQLAPCIADQRCGDNCVDCTKTGGVSPDGTTAPRRPFCLDGLVCVECRADTDCAAGSFCISGECAPCAVDRRCGPRCGSCGGDTPFCLSDGSAANARCVRCRNDADCVAGRCDPKSHQCGSSCAMTCAAGLHCDGARCVECYADTHCPCASATTPFGACDLESGTCTDHCTDSSGCLPGEHCTKLDHVCTPGRVAPGTDPEGGAFCNCLNSSIGGRRPTRGASGALVLITLFILVHRRVRNRGRR
jgi:outer membrane exchange protein TraA